MFKIFFKKKFLSFVLTLTFLINMFSNFSSLSYASINILDFESFGSKVESFSGSSIGKVVIINDLHQNEEVQRNIAGILKSIKAKEKENFKRVYVEGLEAGKLNLEILKVLPSKEKKKYLDEFMRRGLLTGAEKFLAEKKKEDEIEIFGAEEKSLYLENFRKFYKSFEYLRRLSGLIKELNNGFKRLKRYFTFNEIEKFLCEVEKFNLNMELAKYIKYLEDVCKDKGINFEFEEIKRVKNLEERKGQIKFYEAQIEATNIVKKLDEMLTEEEKRNLKNMKGEKYYLELGRILDEKNISIRENYKFLIEYLNFLKEYRSLDEVKLINEISLLEEDIIKTLTNGKKDINKFFVNERKIKNFVRYLKNELSYFEAKSADIDLGEIEEFGNKIFHKNYFETGKKREIEEAAENMTKFYNLAEKRNEVMANNLLREKFKKDEVRAIVLGGFHAGGVKELLRTRGISFIEIMPKSNNKIDNSLYKSRVEKQGERFELGNENKILGKNDRLQVLSVFSDMGLTLSGDKIEKFVEFLVNEDNLKKEKEKKLSKKEELKNLEEKYNKLDDDLKYMISVLAYYSGNKDIDIESFENNNDKELSNEAKILKEAGKKLEKKGKILGVNVNLSNIRELLRDNNPNIDRFKNEYSILKDEKIYTEKNLKNIYEKQKNIIDEFIKEADIDILDKVFKIVLNNAVLETSKSDIFSKEKLKEAFFVQLYNILFSSNKDLKKLLNISTDEKENKDIAEEKLSVVRSYKHYFFKKAINEEGKKKDLDKNRQIESTRNEYIVYEKLNKKVKDLNKYYGFFDNQNDPFIVSKAIKGVDLKHFLEKDTFKKDTTENKDRILHSIQTQLFNFISNVHKEGFIWNDLQPENIMIEKDYNGEYKVKIIDLESFTLKDNKSINKMRTYKSPYSLMFYESDMDEIYDWYAFLNVLLDMYKSYNILDFNKFYNGTDLYGEEIKLLYDLNIWNEVSERDINKKIDKLKDKLKKEADSIEKIKVLESQKILKISQEENKIKTKLSKIKNKIENIKKNKKGNIEEYNKKKEALLQDLDLFKQMKEKEGDIYKKELDDYEKTKNKLESEIKYFENIIKMTPDQRENLDVLGVDTFADCILKLINSNKFKEVIRDEELFKILQKKLNKYSNKIKIYTEQDFKNKTLTNKRSTISYFNYNESQKINIRKELKDRDFFGIKDENYIFLKKDGKLNFALEFLSPKINSNFLTWIYTNNDDSITLINNEKYFEWIDINKVFLQSIVDDLGININDVLSRVMFNTVIYEIFSKSKDLTNIKQDIINSFLFKIYDFINTNKDKENILLDMKKVNINDERIIYNNQYLFTYKKQNLLEGKKSFITKGIYISIINKDIEIKQDIITSSISKKDDDINVNEINLSDRFKNFNTKLLLKIIKEKEINIKNKVEENSLYEAVQSSINKKIKKEYEEEFIIQNFYINLYNNFTKKGNKDISFFYHKGKEEIFVSKNYIFFKNISDTIFEKNKFLVEGKDCLKEITLKNIISTNKIKIYKRDTIDIPSSSAFLGTFSNDLFGEKVKTKAESEISSDKNLFNKLKDGIKNSKNNMKEFLKVAKEKLVKFFGKLNFSKNKNEKSQEKIIENLEKLLGEKLEITLNSGKVEIADFDSNELQSSFEKDGENYRINYRMTEGFLKVLGKVKNILDEKSFNNLLEGIALHEKLENLYKIAFTEFYKEKYGDRNIEKDGKTWKEWEYYLSHEAHDFAMEFAGEEQRVISENFDGIGKLLELEEKLNIEEGEKGVKNLQKEVEEAINDISRLKRELNGIGIKFDIKNIYKNFPNLKKEINQYIKGNILTESREIVIDISGKNLRDVENKLIKLNLQNNYGLKVILVGELKEESGNLAENKKLSEYLSNNYKNSLCDLTWVLGRSLINDKNFKKDEKLHRVVENLANGYILTASGAITNEVYRQISEVVKKEFKKKGKVFDENMKIPSKIIANILNLGFLGEEEYKNVYESFTKSDLKNIKENINQIVLGQEVLLGGNLINKVESETIKVIEKEENGLVLVKDVALDKIKELNLGEMEGISVDKLESLEVAREEKIELEGVDEKAFRMQKIGFFIKKSMDKFFRNLGLKDNKAKLQMNENIRAFASAA